MLFVVMVIYAIGLLSAFCYGDAKMALSCWFVASFLVFNEICPTNKKTGD